MARPYMESIQSQVLPFSQGMPGDARDGLAIRIFAHQRRGRRFALTAPLSAGMDRGTAPTILMSMGIFRAGGRA